jgi:hypothetical protein
MGPADARTIKYQSGREFRGKRDFTKFNGVNFLQWKYAVMLKLKQKKLDGIVLGNDKKTTEVIWTKIFQLDSTCV